jgi:DNA-binding response OmpR family regulator
MTSVISPTRTTRPVSAAQRAFLDFTAQLRALPVIPTVHIDISRRTVAVNGEPKTLTAREFDLLARLALTPDTVVGRDDLLTTVWRGAVEPTTRTIDVHVGRIRAKLGIDTLVTTVRGRGYRLNPAFHLDVVGR